MPCNGSIFKYSFHRPTHRFVEPTSRFMEPTCRFAEPTLSSYYWQPLQFLDLPQTNKIQFYWFCRESARTDTLLYQTDSSFWNKYSFQNSGPTRFSSTGSVWGSTWTETLVYQTAPLVVDTNRHVGSATTRTDRSHWKRHKPTRRFGNYMNRHVDLETTQTDTSVQKRHEPTHRFRTAIRFRNWYRGPSCRFSDAVRSKTIDLVWKSAGGHHSSSFAKQHREGTILYLSLCAYDRSWPYLFAFKHFMFLSRA